jgi:hypothetical protein
MSWRTNEIAFPVRLVENTNVPGVFYVHDDDDDEICVIFGQTEATGNLIVSAINSSRPENAPMQVAAE